MGKGALPESGCLSAVLVVLYSSAISVSSPLFPKIISNKH